MRLAALSLLLPLLLPAVEAQPHDVLLYVRVEGTEANVFRGWVEVPASIAFTAHNSDTNHTIDGHTPLGALLAAARQGGFAVLVTDEFLGLDLSVDAVEGEWTSGLRWWDFRVNGVATYYGAQAGWLAFGPGLGAGDEVLWYLETIGASPLRARATAGAPLPDGGCAFAVQVDVRFPDTQHRAGQPWPSPAWAPVPVARLAGTSTAPVVAGTALLVAPPPGAEEWAEKNEAAAPGPDLVRSDRILVRCP